MNPLTDGYQTGLGAAVWAAGALLGLLTALGPWAAAVALLRRSWRHLATTRTVWQARAWLAHRRRQRAPS